MRPLRNDLPSVFFATNCSRQGALRRVGTAHRLYVRRGGRCPPCNKSLRLCASKSWEFPLSAPSRRPTVRRGFATIVAMVVLGLVVAAIAAGGALVISEQRRTHEAFVTAELRQMLLAGGEDVGQHASQWNASVPGQSWNVPLPPELAEMPATVSINVAPLPDGTISVDVRADLAGERESQTLIYQRTGDVWTLARVDARIH
jgi:hypothetical protein